MNVNIKCAGITINISQDRVWDEAGRKDKTENYIWPGDQVNKNHNDHRPLSI